MMVVVWYTGIYGLVWCWSVHLHLYSLDCKSLHLSASIYDDVLLLLSFFILVLLLLGEILFHPRDPIPLRQLIVSPCPQSVMMSFCYNTVCQLAFQIRSVRPFVFRLPGVSWHGPLPQQSAVQRSMPLNLQMSCRRDRHHWLCH